MTPEEVKDKVRAVLALMREEWRWAAQDQVKHRWCAYVDTPILGGNVWVGHGVRYYPLWEFDIPPFSGDWRESLVER